MIECGKVLMCAQEHMDEEECDAWAIRFCELFHKQEIIFYGCIYSEGKGLYIVGPKEELKRNFIFKRDNKIEDFDFEEYIKNTNDTFWFMDYLTDKGPTLQKMIKPK